MPDSVAAGLESGVLGVQRTAGNRALASVISAGLGRRPALQRDVLPWKEGTIGVGIPRFMPHSLITQYLAQGALNNPVMTKCIQHYVEGTGAPLNLSAAEVKQMWVTVDLFGGGGFTKLKGARDELVMEAQRRQQDSTDAESRQAGFARPIATTGMVRQIPGDNGSALTHALGTAKMTISGQVSFAEATGCTFAGTFVLDDQWDFDVLGPATHRGLKNELETIVGRFGLAGQPFAVTTDPVPVEKNQLQDNVIVHE